MAKKSELPDISNENELSNRQKSIQFAMQGRDSVDGKVEVVSDQTLEDKDPHVELTRETIKMAMGYGEFKGLLPQVTNLDHPLQAASLAKSASLIEIMRAMGMPKPIYEIIMGHTDNTFISGIDGFLRARMAVIYPGLLGSEMHPRKQLFGGITASKEAQQKRGITSKIMSMFG